jgi:hypothetical protein
MVGYSLGSLGAGSTSVEVINAAASGPHWLTISLLGCIGVSGGLFGFLKPVRGYKIAEQEISWLKDWASELGMALIKVSDPHISRDEMEAILQQLADNLRRLRARIGKLRETKALPPTDSPFN